MINKRQLQTPQRKQQRGLALVSVLLVIALCVILATEMSAKQNYQINRAKNLFERQQAYWYAMGSEHFVKALLQDTAQQDQGIFHLEQTWALEGMSFPVDNGLIEGQVNDLYACFNLNSLYNEGLAEEQAKKRIETFSRYLDHLDIKSDVSHQDLSNNLYDWLDEDDYPTEAVGYDGDMYGTLPFGYISANSPLAHENELRVIYGFTPIVMAQLKDKVCAIPQNRDLVVNVNTIEQEHPELLMAMLDIERSKAEEILAERPDNGFKTMDEFWGLTSVKSIKNIEALDKSQFTVQSKFFKLITNAYYNDMKFALTSVIQLDKKLQAKVIARRFGGEVERKANPETEQSEQ